MEGDKIVNNNLRTNRPEWCKAYRRRVEPFDDLFVNVDLDNAICNFHGSTPARPEELVPIFDWIDSGDVELRAISLVHHLSPESQRLLKDPQFVAAHGGGTSGHQALIALVRLYFEAIGKDACFRGNSGCAYAGGWADACIPEGRYFVECGSMRSDKPILALSSRETILLVPYDAGCEFPDGVVDALVAREPAPDCFPSRMAERVESESPGHTVWLKMAWSKLAYELRPATDVPSRARRERDESLFARRRKDRILAI